MTTHPLGDVIKNGLGETIAVEDVQPSSIVDAVLDLDDFLSSDVRLAVRQAAFYTRPELEADIQQLNAELDSLTDSQGRPLPDSEGDLGGGRSARAVALELQAKQKEYVASRRVIVMQQLDEDDWAEFQTKWKEALTAEPPYPPDFYAELISRCAINPKISLDQVPQLRKKMGAPAFDEIWGAAWSVNTRSGVNIPKSLLSSAVLRGSQPG